MKIALKFLLWVLLVTSFHKVAAAAEFDWQKIQYLPDTIRVFAVTSQNLVSGENTSNVLPTTHNGIFISLDLGQTWTKSGLDRRRITDLKYLDGVLYATTYNNVGGQFGLFTSEDYGETWVYKGSGFSASSVSTDKNTVYLGGFSHGLWISKDRGINWTQKFGTGWYGPRIDSLASSDNFTVASMNNQVFITRDNGETWSQIAEFANKGVRVFLLDNDLYLAGSNANNGLYTSSNGGITWKKSLAVGDASIEAISKIGGRYFLAIYFNNGSRDIYEWDKDADTISPTGFINQGIILGIGDLYSENNLLFTVVSNKGVYKTLVPNQAETQTVFLRPPWNFMSETDIFKNINSYFDHEYPLLSYRIGEPDSAKNTVVSYTGQRREPPALYYSSHNGIDFDLEYGESVLAAESGYAEYYYCADCGNTIKVDHQNGYESIYMHLQDVGLVTSEVGDKVFVEKGTELGKVGLTGNTTGPHLHFSILKDTNGDGQFSDEFPHGFVDPYGWQTIFTADPWKNYTWNDDGNTKYGTKSLYLWDTPYFESKKTLAAGENQVGFGDMSLKTNLDGQQNGITLDVLYNKVPYVESYSQIYKYIPGTSLLINAFDLNGKQINTLRNELELIFDLAKLDIKNIKPETLALYFYNNETRFYEILPSTADFVDNVVRGYTAHLSEFALFGEKIDTSGLFSDKVRVLGAKFATQ